MSAKILVIEDDRLQRKMMAMLLIKKLGYSMVEAEDGPTALEVLKNDHQNKIKLVLSDIKMPKMDGLEVLEIITQQYPHLPVIMLTGSEDVDLAVQSMKLGAYDFLNKVPDLERLQVSIQNALKLSVLKKEVSRLKRKDEGSFSFTDLIGYDKGLTDIVNVGRKAASADIPVMVTGETGVGKEVFARAIHGESHRGGQPFVAVNCGAIPENLVESTLFGHEKGAFTGAVEKAIGKFREADGGTIFLDEIGELPLDAQVKILRVLQQKEIQPVGAKGQTPINVRVISATNRDLETEVAEGRFREDLYFRLNVLPIKIPSLRDRRRDIPLLIQHFVERFAASEGRTLKTVSEDAVQMMQKWSWPGNVRELENTIHRAIILAETNTLNKGDFTELSSKASPPNIQTYSNVGTSETANFLDANGRLKTLTEIEHEAIKFSLNYHDHNVTRASNDLGIAKATFYRKMKQIKQSSELE